MEQTGLFGIVKLHSVELPIKKIVEFHNGKKLDPKFLRGFLSLNIDEAIIADRVTKHYDNAAAGWPLAIHQAGDPENPRTGAGSATFSPDRKKIEIRYDLPKQWNDLYQVWNMAFTTQIPTYPLWISKLVIPQMSGYKDYPEQYIYLPTHSVALHSASLLQLEQD